MNNPAPKARVVSLSDVSASSQPVMPADWGLTIANLMALAFEAAKAFDYEKALGYLHTLEEIREAKGDTVFPFDSKVALHREKGKALAAKGELNRAIAEYKKLLILCRESDRLDIKSETFTQIGQLMGKQGDSERALGYLFRAIAAYRRLEDKSGLCKALRNLGVIYVELGEFEEAEMTYDEAIQLAGETRDEMLYADLVNNLGTIMNMRGNWKRALDLYRESLGIYKSLGEVRKSAYTKNNLAITLAERGFVDEAFKYFTRAYAIAEDINDAALTLIVDINLADLYLKREQLTDARRHCERALQYLESSDLKNSNLVEIRKIAGKIAAHEGSFDTALLYFNDARELAVEIGALFQEAEVIFERGSLYGSANKHFDALNDLETSYHLFTQLQADGKRERAQEVMASIEQLYLEVFDSIAREVDRKDKYTKGHSDRVATLSLLLSRELGLQPHLLKTVVAAALLHDIGKIRIDDAILNKTDKLTDAEFREIQKHPEMGVELLRGKEFPWDIKPLILHHHEKLNGNGYPLGLKGEDIPLGARVISIADVFDALTSDRVYRAAFTVDKALTIMREESGTSFDPVLFACFENLVRQGKADFVINAGTRDDEMYSIWSQCRIEEKQNAEDTSELIGV